jgi:hypothetical protein
MDRMDRTDDELLDPALLTLRAATDRIRALTIANAVRHAEAARTCLAELLAVNCPGPHTYRQHRDGRPPWCETCRYTADGARIAQQARSRST